MKIYTEIRQERTWRGNIEIPQGEYDKMVEESKLEEYPEEALSESVENWIYENVSDEELWRDNPPHIQTIKTISEFLVYPKLETN